MLVIKVSAKVVIIVDRVVLVRVVVAGVAVVMVVGVVRVVVVVVGSGGAAAWPCKGSNLLLERRNALPEHSMTTSR